MFLNSDENTLAIEALLSTSSSVQCAVAFLGDKAFDIFKDSKSVIKLICNLDSGATNPYAVEKLIALPNVKIKNQPLLHAKVYLGDKTAIISSANISANGLGLEDDEIHGWLEAGYKVQEHEQISKISSWFSQQWTNAKEINDVDIVLAKTQWKKRREHRPSKPKQNSIIEELKYNPAFFKDKNVYFTITRETMTEEAQELLDDLKASEGYGKNLDAWENWSDLPGNAYYIDLYFGPKRGFQIIGLFHAAGKTVINKCGVSLFLCEKVNSIYGLKLTKKDKLFLRDNIPALSVNSRDAVYVSMDAARKRLFDNKNISNL